MKLVFKRKRGMSPDELVVVDIDGPPRQVNDVVEAIRKRIKEETAEEKELWYKIWEGFEEK